MRGTGLPSGVMPTTTGAGTSPAGEAWRLLGELLHQHKHRFAAIAAEFELSPPQVWALRSLDPLEPVPMSDLACALRCDASNVTGIVDRLEKRGLVERQPARHDRRVKHLVLTDQGSDTRERLLERLDAPPSGIQALSAAEQRQLADLLRRAVEADGPAA
jgi:MarR family transcriptional regulator, organic hydroperoxide resistance regulator